MTAISSVSNSVSAWAVAAHGGIAGGAWNRRWAALRGACTALAMSSTLVVVASMPAFGQAAPDPELDRIWGGCVLSNAALTALQASLTSSSNRIGTPQIAAVVIYSRDNPNSGQPVTVGPTSGFTGAVVCRNAALFPAANTTSQGDPIPPSGGTTTIQNADQSSLFRYGTSEFDMRLCHTVRTNVDCFRYE